MPKSKVRKGRRHYVPKGIGRYGVPNPAELFLLIGQGGLEPEEEAFAAQMLFAEIATGARQDPTLKTQFGDAWPPANPEALIELARLAAWQLSSPTPGIRYDDDSNDASPQGTGWDALPG